MSFMQNRYRMSEDPRILQCRGRNARRVFTDQADDAWGGGRVEEGLRVGGKRVEEGRNGEWRRRGAEGGRKVGAEGRKREENAEEEKEGKEEETQE